MQCFALFIHNTRLATYKQQSAVVEYTHPCIKCPNFAAHNLLIYTYLTGAPKVEMLNRCFSYTTGLLIMHNSLSSIKGIMVLIRNRLKYEIPVAGTVAGWEALP